MAVEQVTLSHILERAGEEPELCAKLAADPLGSLVRGGVRLSVEDLKALFGLAGATDLELLEVLRRRIDRQERGCGGCRAP
jgi:hypothetical protein